MCGDLLFYSCWLFRFCVGGCILLVTVCFDVGVICCVVRGGWFFFVRVIVLFASYFFYLCLLDFACYLFCLVFFEGCCLYLVIVCCLGYFVCLLFFCLCWFACGCLLTTEVWLCCFVWVCVFVLFVLFVVLGFVDSYLFIFVGLLEWWIAICIVYWLAVLIRVFYYLVRCRFSLFVLLFNCVNNILYSLCLFLVCEFGFVICLFCCLFVC